MAATYDAVADHRDEMGEASWRWPRAAAFLELLRAEGRSTLLEIGAGVGYTSRWFADRGIGVVATDLSPEQVARCRTKGLEAHVRDMYDLGFPDRSFDAAWAVNCIHHVPDADLVGVLRGIADVIVPGGPFCLGVWGGHDVEGIDPEDFYQPPRFFSFRSDPALLATVEQVFVVESFETFLPDDEPDDDGLHMQWLVLRRPPASGA
jgi:SAM-dependent methyltransferase